VLQALVDSAHRVGVHPQRLREVSQAWETLPGRQPAVVDARAQRPGELNPDRDLRATVDREVQATV
jgi:hypothetical protein